ncbi:PREDICTED: 1,25-dihydroxyvitamin D(3) 24-hydroxylase, mitochondrial-like [Priapulus caudatus]|uniref:1,25-dihydroxyvitamin D(3) 24-hydroxylase, mitochondrial-like n=1 Tax=Priapulus caudatus TaxID=37621 RepID=A0ABM1DRQ5_PRICU|nr:PREDICTED: 1,25-dihydroxyvitamin D(3) 24-hydroxylase, mitochondrial-like [Priapulus caudatus]
MRRCVATCGAVPRPIRISCGRLVPGFLATVHGEPPVKLCYSTASQSIVHRDECKVATPLTTALPFSKIPGPKGAPLIGSLVDALRNGVLGKTHEFFQLRHRQYGPIYKERIGGYTCVGLNDPLDAERLFRVEGRYPRRVDMVAWEMHRRHSNREAGILVLNGPEWHRNRTIVNKPMLRSHSVAHYTPMVNGVCRDLVDQWRHHRIGTTVADIRQDLFNWSIECVGCILFDCRLGCLEMTRRDDIQQLIQSVHVLLSATERLFVMPPALAKLLNVKPWRDMVAAWDYIFAIAEQQVNQRLEVMRQEQERGITPSGFLATLYCSPKIRTDEIYGNVAELLAAAVETTSNTIHWALFLLAKYPESQGKLWKEISAVISPEEEVTHDTLEKLPYLKAVIKETLRLYPVGIANTRMPSQDIVIRGFSIPAGIASSKRSNV